MKDKFFLLVGIIVVVWSIYSFLQKPAPARYQTNNLQLTTSDLVLRIGEDAVSVEVADTNEERAQGLSGRERLALGTGMLFVFEEPGIYGFWMKDMKFPIDIVWIDENWIVIGVEREVEPKTFPKPFYPPSEVLYVLELNSGVAAELGIDMGSRVSQE